MTDRESIVGDSIDNGRSLEDPIDNEKELEVAKVLAPRIMRSLERDNIRGKIEHYHKRVMKYGDLIENFGICLRISGKYEKARRVLKGNVQKRDKYILEYRKIIRKQ